MKLPGRCFGLLSVMLLCLLWAGCHPTADTSQEDKEPHYLAGRRLVQQRDWKGAERSFHKSLEANPRSSLAHYELGVIYLSHHPNPAAAVYHMERYLALKPDAVNRNEVRGHIDAARRDLAAEIHGTPDAPSLSIQRLRAKVNEFAAENEALKHQLQSRGIEPNPQFGRGATNQQAVVLPPQNQSPNAPTPPTVSALRKHKVKRGDNPYSIARQHRISLSQLLAANPGLNPARLQIGQELKIPPR